MITFTKDGETVQVEETNLLVIGKLEANGWLRA